MERLTRKQCSAILRARAGMLPIKANQKSQHKEDLICCFCKQQEETQEHISIECPALQPTPNDIEDTNLNDDQLRRFANHIIVTERKMEDTIWSPANVRTLKTMGITPEPSNSNSIKTIVIENNQYMETILNQATRDKGMINYKPR